METRTIRGTSVISTSFRVDVVVRAVPLPANDADEVTRHRTATLVGRAIGSLASVLDFNHCYVAGSVALGFGDSFFTTATLAARGLAQLDYSSGLEVRRSGLVSDGPLLGAACVAWRNES